MEGNSRVLSSGGRRPAATGRGAIQHVTVDEQHLHRRGSRPSPLYWRHGSPGPHDHCPHPLPEPYWEPFSAGPRRTGVDTSGLGSRPASSVRNRNTSGWPILQVVAATSSPDSFAEPGAYCHLLGGPQVGPKPLRGPLLLELGDVFVMGGRLADNAMNLGGARLCLCEPVSQHFNQPGWFGRCTPASTSLCSMLITGRETSGGGLGFAPTLHACSPRRAVRYGVPSPPGSFPAMDEVADYLTEYVERFSLPVRNGVRVSQLKRVDRHFRSIHFAGLDHCRSRGGRYRSQSAAARACPGAIRFGVKADETRREVVRRLPSTTARRYPGSAQDRPDRGAEGHVPRRSVPYPKV